MFDKYATNGVIETEGLKNLIVNEIVSDSIAQFITENEAQFVDDRFDTDGNEHTCFSSFYLMVINIFVLVHFI